MNAVVSLDPSVPSVEWQRVPRCPTCGLEHDGALPLVDNGYVFGTDRIAFPPEGVSVATCIACGLVYKTLLPAPHSLAEVFERQAGKKWMDPYDFHDETVELKQLAGDRSIDLLDIGAGNGALLEAWGKYSEHGRRSALDIVQHPGCAEQVRGEFIRGLIESPSLQWSGEPYDVVTLFDVLEHLYDPHLAFERLRELVRDDGFVIIETGNSDSFWPQRYGANHWWYVRLFEHHLFWSRRSLERFAAHHGFRLLVWREVRHKTRATHSFLHKLNDSAQVSLYKLAPRAYPSIAPLLGKYWTQPWSPFTRDHFRVTLRKN